MPATSKSAKSSTADRKHDTDGSDVTTTQPVADGSELVDAKTAALLLGVKLQTLYAYVSRGLIRATPRNGNRPSMYQRRDIEALRTGRGSGATAESIEPWTRWSGGTTLTTAITSITAEGPRYRGKLATDIASRRRSFEDCVELLWTGVLPTTPIVWEPPHLPPPFLEFTRFLTVGAKTACSRQILSLLTGAYAASVGRNPEAALGASVLAGRQLLQILAPAIGLLCDKPSYEPIDRPASLANVIARGAGVSPSEEAIHAINACLILSGDHELAPSTFASRVAASAAADVFSCVNSGLGTFEGPMTGLGCDEPERLLNAARSPRHYIDALNDLLSRKEALLGYNHPLYPAGDPRAHYLVEIARGISGRSHRARRVLNCIDAATQEMGLVPSLAIGLVAVSAALEMPPESPGTLMAIGRVSGWIAHVFEQRLAGTLILPRTRYIGSAE